MPQSKDSNGFVIQGTFDAYGAGQQVAYTGTAGSPPGALFTPKSKLLGTTVPANADTVTIGNKVYTFRTALTPLEGEVLINTTLAAALLNLARAIMHLGTPNTDYKCAAAHTQVTCDAAVGADGATSTLVIYAIQPAPPGTDINAIAVTSSAAAKYTWSLATLGGFTGGSGPRFVRVSTSAASFIRIGQNPTAVALTDIPMAANTPQVFACQPGDRVSAVAGTNGNLNVIEVC